MHDVQFDGAFAELASAHGEFRSAVIGRKLSLAEIYATAGRLEGAYARAGYVLVRVTIPPQRLDDGGVLRILVIDGTIGAIDDTGVPKSARGFVSARLQPLVGQPHLRLAEIDRRLTLAGSAAGLTLRSALKAGARPGSSDLVVEGKAIRVNASLSLDNSLPASLGGHMLVANAALNDLAGLGEQFSFTLGTSGDPRDFGTFSAPYTLVGAGLVLPFGHKGLTLTAGYLHSRTLEDTGTNYLDALGHFTRLGVGLGAALVAGHDQNLSVALEADRTRQSVTLPVFALTLNDDDYISARLSLRGWRRLASGGSLSGSVRLTQGLARLETAVPVPPSPSGPPTHYTKLDGRFTWKAALDQATSLTLTARGQTSFGKPMFVSEKITLAAPDGISAARPGELSVDQGLVLRDELARTVTVKSSVGLLAVSPYVFVSTGFGWTENAAQSMRSFAVQALGMGLQLGWQGARTRAGIVVEYGHCACAAGRGTDDDRLNISVNLGF